MERPPDATIVLEFQMTTQGLGAGACGQLCERRAGNQRGESVGFTPLDRQDDFSLSSSFAYPKLSTVDSTIDRGVDGFQVKDLCIGLSPVNDAFGGWFI